MAKDVLRCAAEVVGGVLDHLLAGLADRLADLLRDLLGDLVGPLHADGEGRPTELHPLEKGDFAPGGEGFGGSSDRGLDLGGRGGVDRAEELVRRRAPDLDLLAVSGNPLAPDEGVLSNRYRHVAPFSVVKGIFARPSPGH